MRFLGLVAMGFAAVVCLEIPLRPLTGADIPVLFWAGVEFYFGFRLWTMGVYETSDCLIVSNHYRRCCFEWADISAVSFGPRSVGAAAVLSASRKRFVGTVSVVGGRSPVVISATDTTKIFIYGRLLTGSVESAQAKCDSVQAVVYSHQDQ